MFRSLRLSSQDERLFSRATNAAFSGNHYRVRVGAVLARTGRPLAVESNRAIEGANSPFKDGHAERRAIAGKPAFKGTLYVARLALNEDLLPSFPCDECMSYIKACACVSKIVYFDGHTLVKMRL